MRAIKYILFLTFFALVIFSPALTSGFAFDDTIQIVNNKRLHNIQNLPYFLTSGINSPLKENQYFTFYYRPIQFTYYNILYSSTNGNPLYFHIILLAFFILDTILVFIFFSKFFSRHISFILALTFLVHPINQTLGGYITDIHDTLYIFFGLLALLIISSKLKLWLKTVISNLLLFLSLLSVEAGILFFPISVLYGKLFTNYKLKIHIPLLTALFGTYLWLRFISYQNNFLTYVSSYPIEQPLFERLKLIPALLFHYYKEILVPAASVPRVYEITHQSPHWLIINSVHLLLIISSFTFTFYLKIHASKYLKPFIFFIIWFLLGLVLYLQIIPLDMLIARRWLTFALIGVLGVLGILLSIFPVKNKKLKIVFTIFFIFYILALSAMTVKLNLSLREWWLHVAPTP